MSPTDQPWQGGGPSKASEDNGFTEDSRPAFLGLHDGDGLSGRYGCSSTGWPGAAERDDGNLAVGAGTVASEA